MFKIRVLTYVFPTQKCGIFYVNNELQQIDLEVSAGGGRGMKINVRIAEEIINR